MKRALGHVEVCLGVGGLYSALVKGPRISSLVPAQSSQQTQLTIHYKVTILD